MSDPLIFRPDLYRAAAPDYERYRPSYPSRMLDALRSRAGVSGRGRLLDLGCGTGQITFGLAEHFTQVWAIDQEEEMAAFGAAKAGQLGVSNITWVAGRAEDVDVEGPFELIAIGNAYHRMDRTMVAERARQWLAPGACIALLWGEAPWGSLEVGWGGPTAWQRVFGAMVREWTERTDAGSRVPAGWEQAIDRDPHRLVLERAGLRYEGQLTFPTALTWTVDSLAGFVYSTSFLNRTVFGENAASFEAELRDRLLAVEPDGVFRQVNRFKYELGRRP